MPNVYTCAHPTPIIRDMQRLAADLGITGAIEEALTLISAPVSERNPDAVRECLRQALAGLGVNAARTPDALDRLMADVLPSALQNIPCPTCQATAVQGPRWGYCQMCESVWSKQ